MSSVIYQPSVSVSLASARLPVANSAQRVLLCGQSLSTGSAVDGAWVQNIGNAGEEVALFGADSMLADMVRAFKQVAPQVRCDAIAVRDSGSTKRVVGIGITGTSTAAGTLTFRVGRAGREFNLAVASGTAAATVLSAAATLLNADTSLPFDVTVVSTTLTFTAVHAGTVANELGIEVSGTVAGLTVGTPTQSVAGATDPTLTSILSAIGDTRYHGIVWAWAGATGALTDLLDSRFNVTDQVLDGVGFVCKQDTYANLITYLAGGSPNAKNSPSLVVITDEQMSETGYLGGAIFEAPYIKATYVAAVRALRLTQDAPLSRYLTTPAALDQYGGPALASLPMFNTRLPHLPVPVNGRGFTRLEIEALMAAGGAVLGQDISGSGVICGEVVTTYLTNGAGIADPTWKFLNYVDTASQAREYLQQNLRSIYAQSRLTEGDVVAGRDAANALSIRSTLKKLYTDLAGRDYTLVQSGPDAVKYFEDNLDVSINMSLGKVTITMLVPIVTQLREIIATMTISFSTAG